jgi:hypothetical protein
VNARQAKWAFRDRTCGRRPYLTSITGRLKPSASGYPALRGRLSRIKEHPPARLEPRTAPLPHRRAIQTSSKGAKTHAQTILCDRREPASVSSLYLAVLIGRAFFALSSIVDDPLSYDKPSDARQNATRHHRTESRSAAQSLRSSTGWFGCQEAARDPSRRIFPSEQQSHNTGIRACSMAHPKCVATGTGASSGHLSCSRCADRTRVRPGKSMEAWTQQSD